MLQSYYLILIPQCLLIYNNITTLRDKLTMIRLSKIEAHVCGLSLYKQNDRHLYVCNHIDKLHINQLIKSFIKISNSSHPLAALHICDCFLCFCFVYDDKIKKNEKIKDISKLN